MSNTRYLEVSSTYRDRTRWPSPGEFEIPISQSGTKDKFNALDPVCTSTSLKTWISNRFLFTQPIYGTPGSIVDVQFSQIASPNTIAASSTQTTIIIYETNAGSLQRIDNYYLKAVLRKSANLDESARILYYKFLGNGFAELIIDSFLNLVANEALIIQDPTDLSSKLFPYWFIPNGNDSNNSYSNQYLYNDTINEYRLIEDYDANTHLLTVRTNTSDTSKTNAGPVDLWSETDILSIRQSPVTGYGILDCYGTALSNPNPITKTSFVFQSGAPNVPTVDLTGDFLEISFAGPTDQNSYASGNFQIGGNFITTVVLDPTSPLDSEYLTGSEITVINSPASGATSKITAYDALTRIATVSPGFPNGGILPIVTQYFISFPVESRRIVKYVNLNGIAENGSLNYIDLPSICSDISNFYDNLYIRILTGAAAGDVRMISSYFVGDIGGVFTRRATVYTPFSAAVNAGDQFEMKTGIVSPSFPFSISTNNFFINTFSYDNLYPFVYTGSTISQQEMVCYELQLLNLRLPNQLLETGNGSRIAFYPYVYVELSNVSGPSSGNRNAIYSNNPNATKATFRAVINDTSQPEFATYITVDGGGMVCTLKFKPNDNLYFSVRLPNGDLYKTIVPEFYSPSIPNPLIQISAMFAMRRVT